MSILVADIEKMEHRLVDAISKSDLLFLDHTIHDDLLCMSPNGETITKEMDMNAHRAGAMVVEELVLTIDEIRIIGDTAVSTVIYNTKGKMMGEPIEGKFKYIRVWKKFDDGLKVIAASCFRL